MIRRIIWMALMLSLSFSVAHCESYTTSEGLVTFDVQVPDAELDSLCNIMVQTKGFSTEEIIKAFSFEGRESNLNNYNDGFIYESEVGLAISDAIYMVDHDNLDALTSFDLSFATLDDACEDMVQRFASLGMDVAIEAAYAIDLDEYNRLYEFHREWIEEQGRSQMDWTKQDVCYVIYLNQIYDNVKVYPGYYMGEGLQDNAAGTEIVVFLFASGIEYISCGWVTEEVERSESFSGLDFLTAAENVISEYNDILTLTPESIAIDSADLVYVTFIEDDETVLKPYWRFRAKTEAGEAKDYLVDVLDGEVCGL